MRQVTEIQKIECAFEFVCPQKWEDLEPTRPGVKYCDTCFSDVFLCTTQEEVDKARGLRQCIAIAQVSRFTMGIPDGSRDGLPTNVVNQLLKEADELYASRKKRKDRT